MFVGSSFEQITLDFDFGTGENPVFMLFTVHIRWFQWIKVSTWATDSNNEAY